MCSTVGKIISYHHEIERISSHHVAADKASYKSSKPLHSCIQEGKEVITDRIFNKTSEWKKITEPHLQKKYPYVCLLMCSTVGKLISYHHEVERISPPHVAADKATEKKSSKTLHSCIRERRASTARNILIKLPKWKKNWVNTQKPMRVFTFICSTVGEDSSFYTMTKSKEYHLTMLLQMKPAVKKEC
ncbi:hypothetical protein CEXT_624851 [Caerostris extrusa]|uniref:Uncharacterized protein n=1 Tax=Caerostris extrusa TaxID=172846 RepID=A0AAV4XY34_CAEEX|nr:hypothetical protein CEXT_624851 [Caerostris extrusa]